MNVEFDPFAGPAFEKSAPTTEPQRELFAAAQMGPEASCAFNESVSLRFSGTLDIAALRSAIEALVDRHESLRATFSRDGLSQFIQPRGAMPVELPLIDVDGVDPDECEARLRAVLAGEVETPFDLEAGPLLRTKLVRLSGSVHQLVITAHHIVVDGWSMGVILRDLGALYTAARTGGAAALDAAPSFVQYARNELAAESGEDYRQACRYWLEQFSRPAPALELPLDRKRPVLKTYASRRIDFPLPRPLTDKLRKAGARLGASYFVTLLAGFAATLHRLTAQDDLVVGIPAAGQAAAGEKDLVGHGVNMLPLRFSILDGMTFADLVKAARSVMLDGVAHQRLSFGALLKQLALQRDPSRLPLTSVLFNVDKAPQGQELGFVGVDVQFLSNPRHFENFELFINAAETQGDTIVEVQYNTDLFDRGTVLRWLGGMQRLLDAAAESPGTRIDSLDLLIEEDQAAIESWNKTAVPYPRDATVQQFFETQADRRGSAPAIVFQGVEVSYQALEARANQIAHALRNAGARAGTLVGLCVDRSPDMVAAMLGILKAGGAYVPLDPGYPRDRLSYMVENSGMPLLLTTEELKASLSLPAPGIVTLQETLAQPDTRIRECTTDAGKPAYVIYTSGSTGTPKGVCVPHRAVSNFITAMQERPGIRETDRIVAVTTLSFDIAVLELHVPLATGACVVLASREEAQDGALLAALLQQATLMQATPATWRLLLAAGWKGRPRAQGSLAGFRALVGGEALPQDLAAQLNSCVAELWNMYGPTETTVWSTCQRILPDQPIRIGKPIANTTVEILDGRLNRQPVGVVGELHIGGDGVTLGYLHRPELTAERFVADPFRPGQMLYKTGDLARWLPGGELECLGRNDNQVKLRGFRIELGEIENALNQHPAVRQAAVIKREDRPGDQRLVGYITLHAGETASAAALRAHLKQQLPEYMIPQGFVTLEKMPLTPNGKIDRKSLPAPAAGDAERHEQFVAPRTPSEELVASLWRDVLGLSRVSVDDDFFALGGHSLLASQILARLRRDHGIQLSFRKMFEAPTISQFAAIVDAAGETATKDEPIPRREGDGPAPSSLAQERMVLLELLEPGRAVAHNLPAAWRLDGALDTTALQRALDRLVARHETLRTTFRMEEGRPVQVVHPPAPQPLPLVDLTVHAEADRERAAMEFCDARTLEPADFANGPLFRSWLLRLGADAHILFILPHNSVWDGWSFDLFLKELSAHYLEATGEQTGSLPALPISYADYAIWQRASLSGPQFARQVEFWQRQLAGSPPTLEIPLDRPRPAVNEHRGADEVLRFSLAEVEALTALGRAHGATLFMVLFAGYNALLHRITGISDLAIGAPTRARSRPEFEDLIGPFVNSVVLRTQVDAGLRFGQLIERVRDVTLEAFNYQDMPLEALGTRPPIVRNYFSLQDKRSRPLRIGGIDVTQVFVLPPAAQSDTMIWFMEGKDGLMAILNYNTALFERSTAARLLRGLRTLLLQAAQTPAATVADLPVAAEEDQAALLQLAGAAGNDAVEVGPLNTLLRPAGNADLVHGPRPCTRDTFEAAAADLAAALAGAGVRPGDRIGLHLQAGADLLTGLSATLRAGGIAASLDASASADVLHAQARDARLAAIVTRDELRDEAEGLAPLVLSLDRLPAPRSAPASATAGQDPALLLPVPRRQGTAWAPVSSAYLAHVLAALARAGVLSDAASVVAVNPPGHELALLEALAAIRSSLRMTAPDVDAVEALEAAPAGVAFVPTTVLESLVATGWNGNGELKVVAIGPPPSSALQAALIARCQGLWHAWGHPSAGSILTLRRVESPDERALLGRPIAGIRLDVVDARGELLPQGAFGMLRASGATLADAMLLPLRARWTADGQLEAAQDDGEEAFHRGWRFVPAQIEDALATHEAVARAAVEVRRSASGDEELIAYVVRRGSAEFTTTELRRHLRRSFPRHLVPATVLDVPALPELATGEVDRSRLEALDPGRGRRFIAPSTASEQIIATMWTEALGLQSVSATDKFFDLGGYSLLCFQLIERIERQTGKRLHPRSFVLDTLGQLAAQLD